MSRPQPLELGEAVALLERTPRLLRDLLSGLPEPWLTSGDGPDGWAARDVVGHLISAELEDWIPRAEIIMTSGADRPFEPFDRFAHETRDRDRSLDELLDEFTRLRQANLERLRELVTEADLERPGRHPTLGPVTMRQLIATWAVHDLDHTRQLLRALAYDRREAVGPWIEMLGIVRD